MRLVADCLYCRLSCGAADNPQVQRHLAFYHGVVPLLLKFSTSAGKSNSLGFAQHCGSMILQQQVVTACQHQKADCSCTASPNFSFTWADAVPLLELLTRQLAAAAAAAAAAIAAAAAAAAVLPAEETFDAAMQELVSRGYLGADQLVALVMSGRKPIWRSASTHSIQV
jgi:hypothetical protein